MSGAPHSALVVDVDGVVSPVHGPTDWGDDVIAGWMFGNVCVSPELCRKLDRLAAVPGLCPLWLSSWNSDMRVALDPFPGRHWPDIKPPDDHGHERADVAGWWKAAALIEWLDHHPNIRSLVWVDDHLGQIDESHLGNPGAHRAPTQAQAFTDLLAARGIAAHLVAPDTAIGLTRAQVRGIESVLGLPSD